MSLSIDQILEHKNTAEVEIRQALKKFEEVTGLQISDLDLEKVNVTELGSRKQTFVSSVNLKVEL